MNKNSSGYLVHDIGLIVLLISVFTGAMTVSYTEKSLMNEAVLLFLGTFLLFCSPVLSCLPVCCPCRNRGHVLHGL